MSVYFVRFYTHKKWSDIELEDDKIYKDNGLRIGVLI